jgi:hypothetical protein
MLRDFLFRNTESQTLPRQQDRSQVKWGFLNTDSLLMAHVPSMVSANDNIGLQFAEVMKPERANFVRERNASGRVYSLPWLTAVTIKPILLDTAAHLSGVSLFVESNNSVAVLLGARVTQSDAKKRHRRTY